jgi:hypothetical protein
MPLPRNRLAAPRSKPKRASDETGFWEKPYRTLVGFDSPTILGGRGANCGKVLIYNMKRRELLGVQLARISLAGPHRKAVAKRAGYELVDEFYDAAVSGADPIDIRYMADQTALL